MNIVTVFKLNWVIAFFSLLLFLFFFGVESWVIANVSVGFDFWIGLLGDLIEYCKKNGNQAHYWWWLLHLFALPFFLSISPFFHDPDIMVEQLQGFDLATGYVCVYGICNFRCLEVDLCMWWL